LIGHALLNGIVPTKRCITWCQVNIHPSSLIAGISKPQGCCPNVRAKYGQEFCLLRLPFRVSSMYKSNLVSKLRGYCRQVRTNAARKFTCWDFPFGFRRCMSLI
jgi:hypothetical protein